MWAGREVAGCPHLRGEGGAAESPLVTVSSQAIGIQQLALSLLLREVSPLDRKSELPPRLIAGQDFYRKKPRRPQAWESRAGPGPAAA